MFIDAALLEVNSGALDDISNNLLVDIADLSVGHLGNVASYRRERVVDSGNILMDLSALRLARQLVQC